MMSCFFGTHTHILQKYFFNKESDPSKFRNAPLFPMFSIDFVRVVLWRMTRNMVEFSKIQTPVYS